MALHAARIARTKQGGPPIRRAGRGQGRRAADRESSRSRVGPVDVDAGAAARAPHRAAGSVDEVLRHRFQLRRSRGARRRSVRLPAARRRRPIDGAPCWHIESTPSQKKISQYTKSTVWIRKDNYALAQVESYVKAEVVRRLKYSDFVQSQGIWTGRRLEMTDLRRKSRTILTLEKLEYNVPLERRRLHAAGAAKSRCESAVTPSGVRRPGERSGVHLSRIRSNPVDGISAEHSAERRAR